MAYVAVKGGQKAIEASLKLLAYQKISEGDLVTIESIKANMKLLVDQVMSEASLYSPDLAARSLWQAEGSVEEAVFLLRAYRSTLERIGYTERVETNQDMLVKRRISAAFKDIPGGQILGASYDYMHRLIDFSTPENYAEQVATLLKEFQAFVPETTLTDLPKYPKVADYLREVGLLQPVLQNNTPPVDVTKKLIEFPTQRSERLQTLTRGMSQALMMLAYSVIRGFGPTHPTVGELRVGDVSLYVDDQYIGTIEATEVEMFMPVTVKNDGVEEMEIEIGYGFVFGRNETKAISMGILDHSLETKDATHPTGDEEFVLYHVDSIESTGFLSHLKLPHYVTFQSKLDSIRKTGGHASHEL